jgi:hypothetical protein
MVAAQLLPAAVTLVGWTGRVKRSRAVIETTVWYL